MKIVYTIILLLFSINMALAENFNIESYAVDINVLENNVIKVIEKIDVDFKKPSHGIIRSIPTKNYVTRQDGTKEINNAKISNIQTNEQTKVEYSSNYYNLRLGNPDDLIEGIHRYTISYNYKLQNDKLKDKDEFYFNIIGPEWDVDINHAKFRVKMPKPFDKNKVGISIGKIGQVGFTNRAILKIKEDKNTILAKTTEKLSPKEGITLRVELPEGYFQKQVTDKEKYTTLILALFFTIISFFNWYKWGKDEKVIPVVNFYPPKNINSGALGVLYRGSSDNKDVVSLIIYLASKGYIKIVNNDDGFIFEKLKEYEDNNSAERKLMASLFKDGNVVTKDELKVSKSFYMDCFEVQMMLDRIKEKIFEKKSVSFSAKIIPLASIFGLMTLFIYVIGDYFINFDITYLTSIGCLMLTLFATSIVFSTSKNSSFNWILPVITIMFHIFAIIGTIQYLGINIMDNVFVLTLIYACILISSICLYQMPKRNKVGIRVLGHILGFKKFIESAQKHQIETLVEKDVSYCYDILPFAYVLGVVDKWIKNFEDMTDYSPSWYVGNIDSNSFNRFTDSIKYVTSPSYENGGKVSSSSSGGGGFSGGGSGGGGGSSW